MKKNPQAFRLAGSNPIQGELEETESSYRNAANNSALLFK